jgi:hypothetical protein
VFAGHSVDLDKTREFIFAEFRQVMSVGPPIQFVGYFVQRLLNQGDMTNDGNGGFDFLG